MAEPVAELVAEPVVYFGCCLFLSCQHLPELVAELVVEPVVCFGCCLFLSCQHFPIFFFSPGILHLTMK